MFSVSFALLLTNALNTVSVSKQNAFISNATSLNARIDERLAIFHDGLESEKSTFFTLFSDKFKII